MLEFPNKKQEQIRVEIDEYSWDPNKQSIYSLMKILYDYLPYELDRIDVSTIPKARAHTKKVAELGLNCISVDYRGNLILHFSHGKFVTAHIRDFKTY